jgi:hypothetical protein
MRKQMKNPRVIRVRIPRRGLPEEEEEDFFGEVVCIP